MRGKTTWFKKGKVEERNCSIPRFKRVGQLIGKHQTVLSRGRVLSGWRPVCLPGILISNDNLEIQHGFSVSNMCVWSPAT